MYDMYEQPITLTPRQYSVCLRLVKGLENPEIGRELGIAVRTVKAVTHNLYSIFHITEGCKRI